VKSLCVRSPNLSLFSCADEREPLPAQLPENRWRFELSLRTGESPSEMTKTEVVHRLMREQGLQPDEFKIEQTVRGLRTIQRIVTIGVWQGATENGP
jgi:hypothetical protein